jgi:hypothetical protein
MPAESRLTQMSIGVASKILRPLEHPAGLRLW